MSLQVYIPETDNRFDKIRKKYEKTNIKEWDFKDLEEFITVDSIENKAAGKKFSQKYYPV